ncbi:FUSC family protein [Glycomyces xiaoerkulensis]|uniref:FUSC family protein n=1 Tax=Glycomyces xiaoerkulensis TaxID=2038139 RepID=UPI000C25A60F|nr:aromatic acid exporter family protein [Glycomyces xiaoerkulensis]
MLRLPRRAFEALFDEVRRAGSWVRELARSDGSARRTLAQTLKATGAAILAWWIAAEALELTMPYVAPLVAMIMVRDTVYWSILSGLQQVAAVAIGLTFAYGALALTESTTAALALALPLTLLIGRSYRLDDQGIYAPFAALFLLTLNQPEQEYLRWRLLETVLGAGIGTLVNLSVLPPVHIGKGKSHRRHVAASTAGILRDLAAGLREGFGREWALEWVTRASELDDRISNLRATLREGRRSLWLNPRWPYRRHGDAVDSDFHAADRLSLAAESVQTITDILGNASRDDMPDHALGREFAERYARFLDLLADAIPDAVFGEYDPSMSQEVMSAFGELEAVLDGVVDRVPDAEMRGALLLAARQLLHDLAE